MCYVKITSAERIDVGFVRHSVEYLVELVPVVPCSMSSDDVEWLVFACPFDNGMF